MQLIGARTIRDINDGWGATVRCRSSAGLYFELGNRIHGREQDQIVGIVIHALDAVQQIDGVFRWIATDYSSIGTSTVRISLRNRVRGIAFVVYARRKIDQLREVAAVQRQVLH